MGSLLGSKGSKSSNSSGTTPGFTDQLAASLAERQKSMGQYSKQQAIDDVQGVLRTQATDALQQVMPSIAGSQISSGLYGTTTKELLRNDAKARITAQLANTQLQAIKDYAGIEQRDIDAFSGATKANTTITSSGSSKGGGSGLLGLFADGGQVPEVDKLSPSTANDNKNNPVTLLIDQIRQATKPATESSNPAVDRVTKSQEDDGYLTGLAKGAASTAQGVSDSLSGIDKVVEQFAENYIVDSALSVIGFADGGKVPQGISKGKTADHTTLLEAIKHHANGGKVRTGESDVQAGGKIRGPQTKSGEDNQVIAVGGGEGIIAADVMKIPGIAELVDHLNTNYHTPTEK